MHQIIRHLAVWLLAAIAMSQPALAAYPEKDITFIIPTGPGGTFDAFVRTIGHVMERYLPNKVHVVPLNIPGGNGSKAVGTTFRARPDGYTIQIFDIPGALLPQIANQPPPEYDLRDFTWLGYIGQDPYGMAVNGHSAVKSVEELKGLGRPVKFLSTGAGATSYLATRITSEILGINANFITGYRGANEYVIGAIRGDGDAAVAVLPMLRKYKDSGDLRVIAYLTKQSPDPEVLTAAQLGHPELANLSVIRLIGGPPGLPPDVKAVLEEALLKAMADPETVKATELLGANLDPKGGDEAKAVLLDSIAFYTRYRKYILEDGGAEK